jgi:hypothetical protein
VSGRRKTGVADGRSAISGPARTTAAAEAEKGDRDRDGDESMELTASERRTERARAIDV